MKTDSVVIVYTFFRSNAYTYIDINTLTAEIVSWVFYERNIYVPARAVIIITTEKQTTRVVSESKKK